MGTIRCRSAFPGRPDRDVPWDGGSAFDALRAGGQPIASSCAGETVCARCTVRVLDGDDALSPPRADERALLERRAEAGERLACRLYNEGGADLILLTAHYW